MSHNKLITAIMVNKKTLLKKEGKSELPFGCEYSIYMKNIENRKVAVEVTIDGRDVLNGKKIILNPNQDIELERFVEDMNKGRKFRFIEKTKEIEEFRGNKPEDGLIVISYTYERKIDQRDGFGLLGGGLHVMRGMYNDFDTVYAATNSIQANASSSLDASCSVQSNTASKKRGLLTEKGITVEGSESKQHFYRGNIGELEYTTNVETIELFGYVSKDGITPMKETIFIAEKFCPSCGTRYEHNGHTEYCVKDGTFLKETINGFDIKQYSA